MSAGFSQQSGRDSDDAAEWLAEDIASLRGAVRQHAQSPDGDGEDALRKVVTPIARRSRENGLEAAQVVVSFKQTWLGLPEVRKLPRRDSRQLLDRAPD